MLFTLAMLMSLVPGETSAPGEKLPPGDHYRAFDQGDWNRRYLVHVPEKAASKSSVPVVLVLHGAAMNAARAVTFTQMNTKADEEGFLAVYPEGTGLNPLLTWNSGGLSPSMSAGKPDDVAYIEKVLDDLATVASVDRRRVYATGMSNGGMMCYLLANKLSHRIAAIAPVAGTMTYDRPEPSRPIPILHIHGDADTIVPFAGPKGEGQAPIRFLSVDATIQAWVAANRCAQEPQVQEEPPAVANRDQELARDDGTRVLRKTYAPRDGGSEVVLLVVQGGGHTWPGVPGLAWLLGKTTRRLHANDAIWSFFSRHQLP